MNKPQPILFFLPFNTSMSGGPRVLLNLLLALDGSKLQPHVITTEDSPLTQAVRERGIRLHIIEPDPILSAKKGKTLKYGLTGKWKSRNALRRYNERVFQYISEHNIRLVWARNLKGVMFTGRAARRGGIPLIWDIGMETEPKGIVRLLQFLALRQSAAVVTEGGVFQQKSIFGGFLYGLFQKKFKTIPPGIPRERIISIEEELEASGGKDSNQDGIVKILTIGTVGPRKNQLSLVKAVGALYQEFPGIRLEVIGPAIDENYMDKITKYLQENKLDKVITFQGWKDNIPAILADADIFALPSKNEGIPYAIHEAMHAQLPVVAGNVGGIPSAVSNGKTGFLVDPDSQEHLIIKLRELIQNRELRLLMGSSGKRRAENEFSPEEWASRYQNLMRDLIEANQKGRAE